MEGLRLLVNKLQVAQFGNTDYNKEFQKKFAVGETVRVPLPQQYTIRNGLGYQPQGINRINTTVSVDQVFGIDFQFDDIESALKMERGDAAIKKNYLEPAMAQIAQEIDSRAALFFYQNTSNVVGILGTDPTSFQTFSQAARQRLIEQACPPGGDRGVIIPPSVNTALTGTAVGYFNPTSEISRQYKEGSIGRQGGFDWYESMSVYQHTAGTWAGAVTLSAAATSGSNTLAVTCTTGDTFNKGDVITVAASYAVNPRTRRVANTSYTKQFTILENAVGVGSAATLSVYPTIYGPGSQYQNVDALPANGAALTLFPGTTSPNGKTGMNGLAIHKDAFAIVGVEMEMPKAVEMSSQTRDPETGIAIRFVRSWNPTESRMENRFDVLMGFGVLYGDNCCVRLLSA